MDEKTKKLIKERFDALPKAIQEIILSSNYEEALLEIGKQYQLNVEQLGVLERETTLTMMGLTPTKDFETELTRELKVDKTKGSQVVKDINEKIFLRIRDLLKLMNTPIGEEPSVEEEKTKETQNNGAQVLNKAGIEIIEQPIPARNVFSIADAGGENREEMLKKIEKPEMIHPILTQRLSGSMQTPIVKTDHSLSNLTPNNTPSTAPKTDPYRMPIE